MKNCIFDSKINIRIKYSIKHIKIPPIEWEENETHDYQIKAIKKKNKLKKGASGEREGRRSKTGRKEEKN